MIKTMSETKNNQAIDPDLTAPLADTELIPEHLLGEIHIGQVSVRR